MAFLIEKYHFKTGSLLEGLPDKDFRILKESMERIEINKDKIIFREGSNPRGVFILRKGKVKIYQTNREGMEQIVYIYKKGEIMGYRPLVCNETHPVSAVALENCVVSFIPKNKFLLVLNSSLSLSNRLLVNLAHEFTVWTNKISVFARYPVRERVALSLLILNEKYAKEGYEYLPSEITLSRDDLSNYVGTAKETLVRMLQDLKQRKVIKAEGRKKIIILNTKELEAVTNLY